jgi:tetratricopeptide (TPR) repeat protein
MGTTLSELRRFEEAMVYHKKFLECAQQTGDKTREGRAYGSIACLLLDLSRYQEAIEYEQKHLVIAQQAGDIPVMGKAYGHIGNALGSLSRYDEALEYHKKQFWRYRSRLVRIDQAAFRENLIFLFVH